MDEDNNSFTSFSDSLNRPQVYEELKWSSNDKTSSKNLLWYLIFSLSTFLIGGLIYLFTRDLITAIVIFFCGAILLLYSIKKPKTINYRLTDSVLYISEKAFKISNFKSFAINSYGLEKALSLVPMKRFYPYLYVDLNKEVSADVIQRISQIIPIQKHNNDLFESFFRFIKL